MESQENISKPYGSSFVRCGGAIFMGPDCRMAFLTLGLITIPFVLYQAFTTPWLIEVYGPACPVVAGVLLLLTLIFFWAAATTDPGVIPRHRSPMLATDWRSTQSRSRLPPRHQDVLLFTHAIRLKYCSTCSIYRPPRSVHCAVCDNCVEKFDHHCPWVGNCIGRRNYRYFLCFVAFCCLLCLFIFGTCLTKVVCVAMELYRQQSDVFSRIWERASDGILVGMYTFVMSWFVMALLSYHAFLVLTNQTTYEQIKSFVSVSNPWNRGFIRNLAEAFCLSRNPRHLNPRTTSLCHLGMPSAPSIPPSASNSFLDGDLDSVRFVPAAAEEGVQQQALLVRQRSQRQLLQSGASRKETQQCQILLQQQAMHEAPALPSVCCGHAPVALMSDEEYSHQPSLCECEIADSLESVTGKPKMENIHVVGVWSEIDTTPQQRRTSECEGPGCYSAAQHEYDTISSRRSKGGPGPLPCRDSKRLLAEEGTSAARRSSSCPSLLAFLRNLNQTKISSFSVNPPVVPPTGTPPSSNSSLTEVWIHSTSHRQPAERGPLCQTCAPRILQGGNDGQGEDHLCRSEQQLVHPTGRRSLLSSCMASPRMRWFLLRCTGFACVLPEEEEELRQHVLLQQPLHTSRPTQELLRQRGRQPTHTMCYKALKSFHKRELRHSN